MKELLFDYYLVSHSREDEVVSSMPFFVNKSSMDKMIYSAEILDKLVKRIIKRILDNPSEKMFEYGNFPLLKSILALNVEMDDVFWVRYDAFEREAGGIFFSEFNYDKPCAQREIILSDLFHPKNNPSGDFIPKFVNAFQKICSKYDNPRVAILIDPTHFEEQSLAYLYIDLLKPLGYDFVIAGSKNFKVLNGKVYAFDKEVNVILRQYPTEFLQEVNDFDKILDLFNQSKVTIINDPRIIFGQVKSLFALFWEMVDKKDPFITQEEGIVIRDTIPYTVSFHSSMCEELLAHKDKYVIKAIYGRYSLEVYIGQMCTEEEWKETVNYVLNSDRLHIVQEFCPIKSERVMKTTFGKAEVVNGYCNYGIYMADGEYAGACTRWSTDYLTSDDITWTTPLGVREKSLKIVDFVDGNREEMWKSVNDKAAFEHCYTGGYTGNLESLSLQSLVLDKSIVDQLNEATDKATHIFKKTINLVKENLDYFGTILKLSDQLCDIAKKDFTDITCFVGRFDWGFDTAGDLKLLEFNSETPAGIIETVHLHEIIKTNLGIHAKNPNVKTGERIKESFLEIIQDLERHKTIKTIGIVGSSQYEDWYNVRVVYDLVKELPYRIILDEVTSLEAREGKLFLRGEPLDATYCYYPTQLFENDDYFVEVMKAIQKNTLCINPTSTILSRNKAFVAIIWELEKRGFYNQEESEFIKKYFIPTVLDPKQLHTDDYCIKAYTGYEGKEVYFNFENPQIPEGDYVYQDRIDIQTVKIDIHTATKSSREVAYPVIGTFVVGDKFSGIFSRAGGLITNNFALFVPTFMDEA